MKLNKKILFGLSLGAATIALASCGGEKYNQVVPYATLEASFDTKVATANNNLSLSLKQYYTSLRNLGYDVFETAINKHLYKAELDAYKDMLYAKTTAELQHKEATLNALKYVKDGKALYEITEEKYAELREELLEAVNTSLASAIFSSGVEETINNLTEEERNTNLLKFVNSQNQLGVEITKDDISWFGKDNVNYELKESSKLVQFEYSTLHKLEDLVNGYLLNQASYLSSRKGLYQIADVEYVYDEDKEDEKKNSYYIFDQDDIKSYYSANYKTYGTYHAVVIQFNTLKEALNAINKVTGSSKLSSDKDTARQQYLDIYNDYYSFKENLTAPKAYVVSKDENELSDFNSSIQSLIKDTLKDNEYIIEARNLNSKYVLVYKFDTQYELYDGEENEQLEYNKLSADQKAELDVKIKEDMLKANQVSYLAENRDNLLKASNIKIYDPLFETKFYYSNSDFYEKITDTVLSTSQNIFSMGDYNYTVSDFYNEASSKYATSIINEYLTLEYTNQYYDKFVEQHYIDSDLHDTNVANLESDISTFENGGKSQYPASVGLETYLVGTYGYQTKDDVIKYYYDARQARTTYLARYVFEEWNGDNNTVSTVAKEGFLNNLLETGNETYSTLFEINLDHILINIDDDGDGSPDDPNKFLAKNPDIADDFKAAVQELAKALYLESINEAYSGNTLYEVLTHIKSDYERGLTLKSDPTKNWDQFKEYNFLLTVEKLASSSNITEASVANFVEPFADYVKNIYKFASASEGNSKANKSYDDGIYYFVYEDGEGNLTGHTASTAEDVSYVTYDSLCMTNYGYHMLILNSYTLPRETTSKKSDDTTASLKNITVNLHKYKDDDDKEVIIYVLMDGYNEESKNAANFDQFFIYYVQKENGDSSSLDSNITSLLGRMFDKVISTYVSSNFQNYLIMKTLDTKVNTTAILNVSLKQLYVDALAQNYEYALTEYGTDDTYVGWLIDDAEDLAKWARPTKLN